MWLVKADNCQKFQGSDHSGKGQRGITYQICAAMCLEFEAKTSPKLVKAALEPVVGLAKTIAAEDLQLSSA